MYCQFRIFVNTAVPLPQFHDQVSTFYLVDYVCIQLTLIHSKSLEIDKNVMRVCTINT